MKSYEITAHDAKSIDAAADTLRDIIQGRVDHRGLEARNALNLLLHIFPKEIKVERPWRGPETPGAA
jgi:hypothetical protein